MEDYLTKAVLVVAIGLLLLGIVGGTAWSEVIETVGVGRTKDEAVQKAIRLAVEQALGAYLTSNTEVQQGRVNHDRIVSSSAGYVRSYRVLAEFRDPIDETYKVKLQADVDDHKLTNALDAFLHDARFQKTFQKTTFSQRRIVVLYQERGESALDYQTFGVQTLLDLVQDKLSGYGFRVFSENQLERIRKRVSELMVDDESAIQLARQEPADAVVVASINGAKQQTSDGYNIIRVTVTLKALDVTTGEVFANVQDRDKTLSQGGADISDGISRAAIKAGGPAVDQLVQKIVKHFSGARDQFVVLMIRDVPLSTQDQIEDLLDELGWEYRISSQTGTYMEVEVFSAGDPTSIRRIFRKASQKSGLQLTPVDMQGSRVVFSGRS